MAYKLIDECELDVSFLKQHNIPLKKNGKIPSIRKLLAGGKTSLRNIINAIPNLENIDKTICNQIEIDCKYEIYVNRQKTDIKNFNREKHIYLI